MVEIIKINRKMMFIVNGETEKMKIKNIIGCNHYRLSRMLFRCDTLHFCFVATFNDV